MEAVKINNVKEAEYVFEWSLFSRIKSLEHKKVELFEKIESEKNSGSRYSLASISCDLHELELTMGKLEVLYDLRDEFKSCIEVKEEELF